ALGPLWDLQWDAGLRIGAVYYDTQATGQVLSEHQTNNFVGAGPRVGLDARHYLEGAPGFSLFGRLETGVLFGGDTQSFSEAVRIGPSTVVAGGRRFRHGAGAPVVAFPLRLSSSPPQDPHSVRVRFGHRVEG